MCLGDQTVTEVAPGDPEFSPDLYKVEPRNPGQQGWEELQKGFLLFWFVFFSLSIPTNTANGNSFVFNPREFALTLPLSNGPCGHPYFH